MTCSNISSTPFTECRPVYRDPTALTVIENNFAFAPKKTQFRFPKSKRKRIRNKWAKQYKNFRYEVGFQSMKFGGMLIVSTKLYRHLMKLKSAQP